jgi:hypothetical protein
VRVEGGDAVKREVRLEREGYKRKKRMVSTPTATR